MPKKFWNVVNESETAEILIYGQISDESWFEDEITPKKFAEDLKTFGNKDLTVRINSIGGDVFAAQAIYSQLKNYSGKVDVVIDGICASAATIIACAGMNVKMPTNAIYMIHNPHTFVCDYCDEPYLSRLIAALKPIKQTSLNVYLSRVKSKLTESELSKLMDNEKYMTAEEALDYGFIDEIIGETVKIENKSDKIYINSLCIDKKYLKNEKEFMQILKKGVKNSMDEKTMFQKFKNWLNATMKDDDKNEKKSLENDNSTDDENTAESVKNAILAEERKRVAALDDLKVGNAIIDKFIDEAKIKGESVEKVKTYVETMKKALSPENKGMEQLSNFVKDNMNSGAQFITAETTEINSTGNNETEAAINNVVECMNKIRGAK